MPLTEAPIRSRIALSLVYCNLNTFVRQQPDLETVMLPIRDGITIIRRRI